MNIFFLHQNPFVSAQYHCDKHVIKMITETAQMLSTAHRILDGKMILEEKFYVRKPKTDKSGNIIIKFQKRKIKRWVLTDRREDILHLATHINHPCNKWVRGSYSNYEWTRLLLGGLLAEYDLRYSDPGDKETIKSNFKKFSKARQIYRLNIPANIPDIFLENSMTIDGRNDATIPPLAMPDIYKEKEIKHIDSIIRSYRRYYLFEKLKFATWRSPRKIPEWVPIEIV